MSAGRPRLVIPPAVAAAVARHAAAAFPEECCGILVGSAAERTVVRRAVAATNARRDRPRDRYTIPAEELLAAQKAARAEGLDMVGWYHSHPGAPAVPSRFDTDTAWPGASYLIAAVEDSEPGELRSWRLTETGGWVEEEIEAG